MKKLLMVASSGGHLEELSQLKNLINKYECCWVTEKNDYQKYDLEEEIKYYVPQINRRELLFPFKFLYLIVRAWRILLIERPDCVVTTGALISYPFCRIAKAMGKKVIFIESFARVKDLSLTGKLLYNHVSMFVVQWPEIAEKYDKAVVGGGIF